MNVFSRSLMGLFALGGSALLAADPLPTSTPRPVPLTRPEMKQYLEDMKSRPLRIPLPELTAEDEARLGDRGRSYEARLRYHYLPAREGQPGGGGRGAGPAGGNRPAGDFTRNADPNMSLDYRFKTMLFWIVSRTNNCQYCLGHQEQKLSAAGMREEQIAALDFDWLRFSDAEQTAFAYARKLTYEPNLIGDADIAALRKHYTDLQILEMTMSIAGNNILNRWKEGAGIPQSSSGASFFSRATDLPADRPVPNETFLTPTPDEFRTTITKVAPLQFDQAGKPTRLAVFTRAGLENRAAAEQALEACRTRAPRLPMASDGEARAALGVAQEGPLPQWMRLMATFPTDGRNRVRTMISAVEQGDLSPLLKAQVSWIIARQDRAWYAAGLARDRLRALGQTDDQIYRLDGSWKDYSPAERAMFTAARKLAATPVVLTDDDVAEALRQTSPRDVVQLVDYVTACAYFDRVTEPAGLALDAAR